MKKIIFSAFFMLLLIFIQCKKETVFDFVPPTVIYIHFVDKEGRNQVDQKKIIPSNTSCTETRTNTTVKLGIAVEGNFYGIGRQNCIQSQIFDTLDTDIKYPVTFVKYDTNTFYFKFIDGKTDTLNLILKTDKDKPHLKERVKFEYNGTIIKETSGYFTVVRDIDIKG